MILGEVDEVVLVRRQRVDLVETGGILRKSASLDEADFFHVELSPRLLTFVNHIETIP